MLCKVQYSREVPQIECAKGMPQDVVRIVTTKSLEWSYEQEWRIVMKPANQQVMAHSTDGRRLSFPRASLREVYLGARIDQADKNALIRWALEREDPQLRLASAAQ